MTYEPLHHKYRPQTFAALVGQQAIATTLVNALRQQRIAPAYLFTGARGTGKTSSARIFAKSLNCLKSAVPTETPCGVCEVCRAIANGSALDVIEIDAASNTGVDNIRELIERAQFAPVQCRYKVYIIDEVHMLSTAAFNALLKTLEEPPSRVIFVLATTDPQRVLPTIISRCQRFDFRRIPLEEMVAHLGSIAQQEAIDITADAVQLIAQISQGGLRDAESLLDQLSLSAEQVTIDRVWDLVGAVPERDLLALVRAIAEDNAVTVLEQTRRLMDRGREPLIVLQNLASFYRDLLIAKTAPGRNDLVSITPPTWAELCQFVQTFDLPWILTGQRQLRTSELQVKNTTQPRLWLEVTLLGLLPSAIEQSNVGVEPARSHTEIASKPQRSHQTTSAGLSSAPTTTTLETATPSSASAGDEQPEVELVPSSQTVESQLSEETLVESSETDAEQAKLLQMWQQVLALVQPFSTQMMLRQQCHLIAFTGREARIGINSQPLFKMAKDRLPNIEAAFVKFLDQPVKVSLEVIVARSSQATSDDLTQVTRPLPSDSLASFSTPAPSVFPNSAPAPPTDLQAHSVQANPVEALPSPVWQEEDEAMRAAKSLAQLFNGHVIPEEGSPISQPTGEFAFSPSELAVDTVEDDEDEEDEDELPF